MRPTHVCTQYRPASGWSVLRVGFASVDRYTFTVPAEGEYQYQELSGNKTYALKDAVTGATIGSGQNSRQYTLPAGDYVLEYANQSAGSYSWKLFEIPAPQTFAYDIGSTVSNGVPATGAGNLETIASIDRYTFTIPADGTYQYQHLSGGKDYTLRNVTTGTVVGSGWSNKQFALTTGVYQLEFANQSAGAYSWRLFEVPAPQTFAYDVGSTVSNGLPGTGAGNLETIASVDRYAFTIPADGVFQYQHLSGGKDYTLKNLITGVVVGTGWTNKQYTLPAGDYQLEYANQSAGTYSWKLTQTP